MWRHDKLICCLHCMWEMLESLWLLPDHVTASIIAAFCRVNVTARYNTDGCFARSLQPRAAVVCLVCQPHTVFAYRYQWNNWIAAKNYSCLWFGRGDIMHLQNAWHIYVFSRAICCRKVTPCEHHRARVWRSYALTSNEWRRWHLLIFMAASWRQRFVADNWPLCWQADR